VLSAKPGGVLPIGIVSDTTRAANVIDEYINLKDMETIFNGTANPLLIGNVQTGALIIATIGDVLAANQPYSLRGVARLRFRDN